MLLSDKTLRVFTNYCGMAATLLERHGSDLPPAKVRQLRAMAGLWDRPRLLRMASLTAAGLRKPTVMTNLGLMVLVLRKALPQP
jgi:hypothetical protein